MIPSDLDALERLAQKATPGPGHSANHLLYGSVVARRVTLTPDNARGDIANVLGGLGANPENDAPFIAACDPTTILALVALARKGMEAK